MSYSQLLLRAWWIVRRHRILWLFGFLAGFAPPSALSQLAGSALTASPEMPQRIRELLVGPSSALLWIGTPLLLIAAFLIWGAINALGHTALIALVNRLEEGEPPTFLTAREAIRGYAGRIFLIHVLLRLPLLMIAGIFVLPLAIPILLAMAENRFTIPGPMVDTGLFFCCLGVLIVIPASILITWIEELANRACVLDGRSTFDSIAYGWAAIQQRSGPVIALGIRLLGIAGVAGLFTIVSLNILQGTISRSPAGPLASPFGVKGPWGVLLSFGIAEMAINTWVMTFLSSSWTLFYRQLLMSDRNRSP